MQKEILELASNASFQNEGLVKKSKKCGCYSCLEIYEAVKVVQYIDDKGIGTARCPYCGIDAVIPDASGIVLEEKLLQSLQEKWF